MSVVIRSYCSIHFQKCNPQILRIAHIRFAWYTDKLLFVDVRSKNAVIASQFANWRGNPPAPWNQVTITTKIAETPILSGAFRNIPPLTGGLPRHLSALVSQ